MDDLRTVSARAKYVDLTELSDRDKNVGVSVAVSAREERWP